MKRQRESASETSTASNTPRNKIHKGQQASSSENKNKKSPRRQRNQWSKRMSSGDNNNNNNNAKTHGQPEVEEADNYEEYEDYDDYDDDGPPLPRAFAVGGGEPDFASGPPATAEEYLKRVRWEADRCQKVVVSNINPRKFDRNQTQYMPSIQSSIATSAELLPSVEWEEQFAASFADLRVELSEMAGNLMKTAKGLGFKLPGRKDKQAWMRLILGGAFVEKEAEASTEEKVPASTNQNSDTTASTTTGTTASDSSPSVSSATAIATTSPAPASSSAANIEVTLIESTAPLLRIVGQIDQIATRSILGGLIETLQDQPLSPAAAKWLFVLLAKLDKPIHGDVAGNLRSLYRKLAADRLKLQPATSELAHHNIILTIICRCYGQGVS